MIPIGWTLGLSAVLFCIGVAGVLVRRNALVVFMSIELMLNLNTESTENTKGEFRKSEPQTKASGVRGQNECGIEN